ncbi:MAG TPA: hypothetical protein VF676_05910 [Flavobacterium sp.]
MRTHHTCAIENPESNIMEWICFQDETQQFDSWNLHFDEDEDSTHGSDRQDDTDQDDGDPNRYLG